MTVVICPPVVQSELDEEGGQGVFDGKLVDRVV